MDYVTKHATDHERSIFQHLYAQLGEITDEETVENVRRAVVSTFNKCMELDLRRHCTDIRRIIIQPNFANQLNLSCSTEFFWKDKLAIIGTKLIDQSKDGLWINDEVKEVPNISLFLSTIGYNKGPLL